MEVDMNNTNPGATPPGGAIGGYHGSEAPVVVGMQTLKLRLEQAVKNAEQRLAEARRAREILDQHPELEELLNIMQRGHF